MGIPPSVSEPFCRFEELDRVTISTRFWVDGRIRFGRKGRGMDTTMSREGAPSGKEWKKNTVE